MNNIAVQKRWDIFCKVVDNFGDIGVCWRLARQLQVEHGLQIRLYVDNLDAASQIITGLNKKQKNQIAQQVELIFWQENTVFANDATVVIEAFSCGLPTQYLTQNQQVKWVNLEYLSAEKWVDDFHGKHSKLDGVPQKRHFFYPGFTAKTGGLIRESDMTSQLQNTSEASFPRKRESNFVRSSSWIPAFAGMTEDAITENVLKVSLFCYPSTPVHDLLNALQFFSNPVFVYVPESGILPKVAEFFGKDAVNVGEKLTQNNLTVEVLPFLSQAEYDILLRNCDINFVRGEDSWVRAIWASKPFIWQPYFQTEDTHLLKLNAFLDVFYAEPNIGLSKPLSIDGFETKNRPKPLSMNNLRHLHIAWANNQPILTPIWHHYLQDLPHIASHTFFQSQSLANQPDLATQLVSFCNIN